MKKLPIGLAVHVFGHANQAPFEEISDDGIIIDNTKGYLVQLTKGRENLIFKRKELIPKEPIASDKPKKEKLRPYDPFDL
jgi:hypothetical protein